jgi:hypothetical protein
MSNCKENPVTRKFYGLLLCLFFVSAAQAWATVLPDSCGDDKVKFDVTKQKGGLPPSAPESGKAQIFFIEAMDKTALCFGCDVTSRIGIDGAWVGANHGNSYFAVSVSPGEHHLCVDWQSDFGFLKEKVGLTSFTAEPGKDYYYEVQVEVKRISDDYTERSLHLAAVSKDEGKWRIKKSQVSISKLSH